ncbi:hypothetical protein S7711_06650 [Stachybotrys chartarum IBT 7711]|uniref:Zn(2)-C6 fungal-type domain-containing protein n=1 Tax=Stachybotrys chartarum (strain CBS 109288 / IBT 7711) TaxID=1280523 RepID=A0A084BB18_STACB|nr:hypothetical protein S7711_06650 [Stachybotrys chartarum IBT 7711]
MRKLEHDFGASSKCDELKPKCTRCTVRNHCCQYTSHGAEIEASKEPPELDSSYEASSLHLPLPNLHVPRGLSTSITTAYSHPSPSTVSSLGSSCPNPSFSDEEYQDTGSQPGLESLPVFDSTELALLGHYLTHTSRVISYDEDDFYVLHVGIPNLAFRSRPLMSSLLALSASCESSDLVTQSSTPLEHLAEVRELLAFADKHHQASLRQTQASISNIESYEHILATTPLMVLYGSSSHCVRVRLAEAARASGETLPTELLPAQSQWISLIRAAYVAFTGLLNDSSNPPVIRPLAVDPQPFAENSPEASKPLFQGGNGPLLSEDGPSQRTKQLFSPIVASTYSAALEKLRTEAQSIDTAEGSNFSPTGTTNTRLEWQFMMDTPGPQLEDCVAALEVLTDIFSVVFTSERSVPGQEPLPSRLPQNVSLGRLDRVHLWLRNYVARVTSASPSTVRRRAIMAFLNRVSTGYLTFVQSILDTIPMDQGLQSPSLYAGTSWRPNATQKLAMNVFAHWLVLVVLLDGVWWIGEIGQWELRRVVSFMRTQHWVPVSFEPGDRWWPGSMQKVHDSLKGC